MPTIRFRILSLLVVTVGYAAAQSLEPPAGWTIRDDSGALNFSPSSMRSGQDVLARVYDPEPPHPDLASWLSSRLSQERIPNGVAARCRPKLRAGIEASCVVNGPNGDHYFYAFRLKDGRDRFLYLLMAPNTLATVRYFAGIKHILEGTQSGLGRSSSPHDQSTPPSRPSESQTTVAPPFHAPSTPISAGELFRPPLKGIYLHLEYQAGVGGGIYPVYSPYIMLEDGTITDDLVYYPRSEADMAAWRNRKPQSWGTWSAAGKTFSIRWNNSRRKPETWDKWFLARPGKPGQELTGSYQSLGGGGNTALGGDVMIAGWKDLTFLPGGRVTTGGGSGGFSGGAGTGVSVATSNRKPAQTRQYRIDGYSITFDSGNGAADRRWFYLFPDSDTVFGVGGDTFTSKSK